MGDNHDLLKTVCLMVQYKEYGYIPAALPDKNCFGDAGSRSSQPISTAASTPTPSGPGQQGQNEPAKPLPAPSQAFQELLDKVKASPDAAVHNS